MSSSLSIHMHFRIAWIVLIAQLLLQRIYVVGNSIVWKCVVGSGGGLKAYVFIYSQYVWLNYAHAIYKGCDRDGIESFYVCVECKFFFVLFPFFFFGIQSNSECLAVATTKASQRQNEQHTTSTPTTANTIPRKKSVSIHQKSKQKILGKKFHRNELNTTNRSKKKKQKNLLICSFFVHFFYCVVG